MSFQFLGTKVRIERADATLPDADALVLPTNNYLWMGGGPALAVKQSAGEEIEQEAVRLGPIPLGEAVAGPAGPLGLKGILHAAVMEQDLQVDPEAAIRALEAAVRLASQRGWTRLVIHSFLATGRGTPRDLAHRLLAHLVDVLLEGSDLDEVVLLALDDAERSILHDGMLRVVQGHR